MNQKVFRKLAFVAAMLLMSSSLSADIILSMDSSGGTNVDTGVAGTNKVLSIFISQDTGATDTVAGVVADFDLEAGLITGSTISSTGATGTPGYWGAGDLNASSITPIDGNTAFEVNQEFASTAHPVMNDPNRERWFDIVVDTTGLSAGTYTLTLRDPAGSFIDNGFNSIGANNNLTFTVSAVPEPGSVAVLALLGSCVLLRRRRSSQH